MILITGWAKRYGPSSAPHYFAGENHGGSLCGLMQQGKGRGHWDTHPESGAVCGICRRRLEARDAAERAQRAIGWVL